jgi:hypothetical protein
VTAVVTRQKVVLIAKAFEMIKASVLLFKYFAIDSK